MSENVTIDLETLPSAICDGIAERLVGDGLIVCRCRFPPRPGAWVTVRQILVVRPVAPVTARWRAIEDPAETEVRLTRQSLHVITPGPAIRIAWNGNDRALAVGLTTMFLETHVAPLFEGRMPRLAPRAAIRDPLLADTMSWFDAIMDDPPSGATRALTLAGATFGLRLFESHGTDDRIGGHLTGGLGASRQRRIIEFIEAHLDRPIPIPEMAGVVGLRPSHFGTAFRTTFGRTPYHYLHERRVEKAKTLLLDPRRPIVDIALEVGYSSHGHFTTVFRKVTGTTPSRFRRDRI